MIIKNSCTWSFSKKAVSSAKQRGRTRSLRQNSRNARQGQAVQILQLARGGACHSWRAIHGAAAPVVILCEPRPARHTCIRRRCQPSHCPGAAYATRPHACSSPAADRSPEFRQNDITTIGFAVYLRCFCSLERTSASRQKSRLSSHHPRCSATW